MAKTELPQSQTKTKAAQVQGETTRCATCGSTDRIPYHRIVTVLLDPAFGVDHAGNPATHRTMKRTACTKCNAPRVDNFFENRVP